MEKNQKKVNIIPLGGLGEIGKNMTVFRYGNDMILLDAGLMFPEDDMLGIDLVIPDITYLVENQDKLRGIFLTHGHEDHIGALPYILKQLDVPVYGTALTLGILEGRLEEAGVSTANLNVIKSGDRIRAGAFKLEFMRVNHSIPDAIGIAIHTPIGLIIHTGDFKIDQTPVDGQVMELNRFAEYGDRGVLLLMADSTNAERPGYTPSEKMVGETFDNEFRHAENRIIIATFSSNVHRIQQICDTAVRYKRKVAVIGRSLTRMSMGENRKVQIVPGDTVIISASPIPGNEKMVSNTINHLYMLGAEVVYEKANGVHVSGHASQEELKIMQNLVRPKFFMPVHGEYRHLIKHAGLAVARGMDKKHIVIAENGSVVELTRDKISINGKVQAGKVLIDGLGVGDVGNIVLRDRRQLSQDGIMIVVVGIDKATNHVTSGPDIVSRGFVYVREAEDLMDQAKAKVQDALDKCEDNKVTEWSAIKGAIRDSLGRFLFDKTRRRPMILPIIMEV